MKRYFLFSLLALFCIMAGYAENHAEKLAKELYKAKSKYVLVVAHRGDWRNAPENSLQAYKNCIDMGVDMIEIDIHKTKDNQFIIMHDATVDRTTNGKGKIADMTLAEIKQLKLRAGHNVVTQHNVPTLEEVLNLVKGKILVNIDKGDNYFDEIYDLLVKTGTEKQVVIKTYDDLATIQSKNKNDIVRKSIFMPIINLDKKRDAEDVLAEYMTVNPAAYEICFSKVTPKVHTVIEKVKATGGKLWLNSMWPKLNGGHDDDLAVEQNKPDEAWGWLLKQGAKLIQTDRPADLIKYLKKKHRH